MSDVYDEFALAEKDKRIADLEARLKDAEECLQECMDKAGSNTVPLGCPVSHGSYADIYETARAYFSKRKGRE